MPIDVDPVSMPPEPAALTAEETVGAGRAVVRLIDHLRASDADAAVLLGLAPEVYDRWKAGEVGPIAAVDVMDLVGILKDMAARIDGHWELRLLVI